MLFCIFANQENDNDVYYDYLDDIDSNYIDDDYTDNILTNSGNSQPPPPPSSQSHPASSISAFALASLLTKIADDQNETETENENEPKFTLGDQSNDSIDQVTKRIEKSNESTGRIDETLEEDECGEDPVVDTVVNSSAPTPKPTPAVSITISHPTPRIQPTMDRFRTVGAFRQNGSWAVSERGAVLMASQRKIAKRLLAQNGNVKTDERDIVDATSKGSLLFPNFVG